MLFPIVSVLYFYIITFPSVCAMEKIEMYKTLISPVATYGAESWTMNEDITKRLSAFERKVLRRMFGGILSE